MSEVSCDGAQGLVVWAKLVGEPFSKGDLLVTVGEEEHPEASRSVMAPLDGTLVRCFVGSGNAAPEGGVLGWARLCRHPTVVSSLCAVCGRHVALQEGRTRVTLSGVVSDVLVDDKEAVDSSASARLRKERKLQLVLDIDNTLLECTGKEPPPGISRLALFPSLV